SPTTPKTPVLDAIAAKAVRFNKFYTMPECSPSRVCFFTGRFPLRTGVNAALTQTDLPAAQLSPYEVTVPKVLATANYVNGYSGKYHLGGPENNPAGETAPLQAGWDYFNGQTRGSTPPNDETIGGQYTPEDHPGDEHRYSCGFPVGATKGACWRQAP